MLLIAILVLLPPQFEQVNPWRLRSLVPDTDRRTCLICLARHKIRGVLSLGCGPIREGRLPTVLCTLIFYMFIELAPLPQTLRK